VRNALRALGDAVVGAVVVVLWLGVVVPLSRAKRWRARRTGTRPTVVWGPVPIVNVVYSTAAERLYGYRSESVVFDVFGINVRERFDHAFDRWRKIPVIGRLVPYLVFVWAGLRFDVYGFFFDGGLLGATRLWRTELALLRLAGKAVVVYPYGSDARVPSTTRELGRWHAYTDVPVGGEDRDEADVRRRLDAFGRYANVVLGCADLVLDLPRLDGVMRYPFDDSGWAPRPEVEDDVVTIVHAPNHRVYKGTRYLEQAVETLRAEGLAVELVLVERVRTDVARETYATADIIADQFLIGAYALFAIEGMALGKPVVCYLNDRFRGHQPEWDDCPIVSANPDALVETLRALVLDPPRRRALGERGPTYVKRYHSLESVGAEMDAIYSRIWP
jgi:glycosyltransferase involved in cell wall biosynthesis